MTDIKIASKKAKAHTIYKNKEGKRLPGVTTIIGVMNKPALIKWANNLGLKGIDSYKYVDTLADIGILGHAMIHHELGGEVPDTKSYSQDQIKLAENVFLKFLEWEKNINFEIIGSEMQIISEKYQFGGTADLIIKINDILTLLDIKTSKAVYKDQFTQVAGYGIALKENGYNIRDYRILRIGRNEDEGGVDYISIPNIELHEKRFLICRELYEINKQINRS